MMLRIAWRSLATRPVRAGVLAAGFGFGIAVMVELLGVGDVMLEQAHAPALEGGGDVVLSGPFGAVQSARFVMTSVLGASDVAGRVKAVSPSKQSRLYLLSRDGPIAVAGHGGIPSLEKAIGDEEVASLAEWTDAPGDARWSRPPAGDVLRAMDRFHPIPDVPARASSWAEWLYFNGRTRDGRLRLYLTFLVGPRAPTRGKRLAAVRLQLERDGRSTSYSAGGEIAETALGNAPDLELAGNRVWLDGLTYRMTLALGGARGEIALDAAPGRSLPPVAIRGANGWISGYTVPALAGTLRGTLTIGRDAVVIDDAVGYHDHNWGFWQGVSWQWGQVAHDDISIVYGRVFPPPDVADPLRLPGFLAVLGREGPLGYATDVAIDDARAGQVTVNARGRAVDLHLTLAVTDTVRTPWTMSVMTSLPGREPLDFFQMGGTYHVSGKVAGRDVDFTARGAAETFHPR
jgi:hypothetical protein